MVKPPYFGVLRLFFLAEQGDRTLGLGTLPRPAPFFGGVYHIRTQCNKALACRSGRHPRPFLVLRVAFVKCQASHHWQRYVLSCGAFAVVIWCAAVA